MSESWGNEDVEGYTVALGVVCLLFTIRAAATEYTGKDVALPQKDILWGISLGTFLAAVTRFFAGADWP